MSESPLLPSSVMDADIAREKITKIIASNTDADDLAELRQNIMDDIDETTKMVEAHTWFKRNLLKHIDAELLKRMSEFDLDALPSASFDIIRKQSSTPEYDTQALLKLVPMIPPAELSPAFREETVLRTDGTKLNALAKRYKGKIAQIISEATSRKYGPEKLIVQRKEQVAA